MHSLTKIIQQIEDSANRSSRSSSEVRILAVSKGQSVESIEEAFAAGLFDLGENKVQEARAKRAQIGERGVWHFIGHLQSNKAKLAVELFDQIDSLDSLELAIELNKRAEQAGKRLPVLLQVNVVGEASKFGISPGDASHMAEQINALPELQLNGLMTLAPYSPDPEKARPCFAGLRECRDRIEKETGLHLPELSMGMSGDFDIAIEEGSTMIRLGTSLFGPRSSQSFQRRAAKSAKSAAAEDIDFIDPA